MKSGIKTQQLTSHVAEFPYYVLAKPDVKHSLMSLLACMCASFLKGDMFIVHNELEDGWMWVTNVRTEEQGLIVDDLVEEVVSVHLHFAVLSKDCTDQVPYVKGTCWTGQ